MATDDERHGRTEQPPDLIAGDGLRHALETAESVNFKIDVASGRAAAFGALPRWFRPHDNGTHPVVQLFSTVHPDDGGRFSIVALGDMVAGDVREGTFRVVDGDGAVHRLRARIRLLRDDSGKPQTLFGVLTEVSSPHRTAQAGAQGGMRPARRWGEAHHDSRQAVLEAAMSEGLDEGQFHLEYQAVVDVWTGEATAAEALARWRHPDLGDIRPDEFIPVAEQSGLIVPLGAWVVGQACRDLAGWETAADFTVCVNVSARQLATAGIDQTMAGSLERAGVPSARLCLEITESVLMEDALTTAATLGRLRDLGIKIAIDDFGTGYSSLVYLRNFPAQILKIDRRFVAGIAGGLEDLAIVRATIELAHALGLVALAEGVETPEQLTILRTLGCDLAQGFLWSVPVPADDFAAMLRDDPTLRFELPRTQSVRSVLSLPGEKGPVLN